MSAFRAGVLTLVVILVAAYFGFTKSNPFADPYELRAIVRDAQNLKPGSPVREAGVEVGKVSKVEAADGSEPATKITMELREDALPVHEDARVQIRPRILLEGNFFVDLAPGSSEAKALDDGGTVPITQTSSSVTLPDVLSVLDSDTRSDLQTLLREYATAVRGGGARALNRAIPSFAPAYRLSALTNDALLGEQPTEDLHRVLRNQALVFGTLSENPQTLQDLVADLNTTAGASDGIARLSACAPPPSTAVAYSRSSVWRSVRVSESSTESTSGSVTALLVWVIGTVPPSSSALA